MWLCQAEIIYLLKSQWCSDLLILQNIVHILDIRTFIKAIIINGMIWHHSALVNQCWKNELDRSTIAVYDWVLVSTTNSSLHFRYFYCENRQLWYTVTPFRFNWLWTKTLHRLDQFSHDSRSSSRVNGIYITTSFTHILTRDWKQYLIIVFLITLVDLQVCLPVWYPRPYCLVSIVVTILQWPR